MTIGLPLSAKVQSAAAVSPLSGYLSFLPSLESNQPDTGNGLQKPSQVMVDKVMTVKRDKVRPAFGRIGVAALVEVERCLAVFLGIAK